MNYKIFSISLLFLLLLLPVVTFGQTPATTSAPPVFVPLIEGGGLSGDPTADFSAYINTLYAISISLAAILAVIKIIIAGVKWMLTDVVSTIAEAKKDIQGALLGLLIIISAVVILNLINPSLSLIKFEFEPIQDSSSGPKPTDPIVVDPILTAMTANCDLGNLPQCADLIARCLSHPGGMFQRFTENSGLSRIICTVPFGPPVAFDPNIRIVIFRCFNNPDNCRSAITSCTINQDFLSFKESNDDAGPIILCSLKKK